MTSKQNEILVAITTLRLRGWQDQSQYYWDWVTAIREYTSCLETAVCVFGALGAFSTPDIRDFRRYWNGELGKEPGVTYQRSELL